MSALWPRLASPPVPITCRSRMLTVKSPSSSCSRISLQGNKQPQLRPGCPRSRPAALHLLPLPQQVPLADTWSAFLTDRANHGPTHMSMAQQTRRRKSKRLSSAKRESQMRMTSGSKNSCDSSSVSQRKAKNWGLMFCSCWGDSRDRGQLHKENRA